MHGIILIDKEKGKTSRDVVNDVSKIIGTKKVGHTGTLDPIASGLLVLCVNEGCKLVELLTGYEKDYIAKVKLGVKTDTYDITGKIIEKNNNYKIDFDNLSRVLNSFVGEYNQQVPIYSAIKVKGKKLYEYARNNESVQIPFHKVNIKKIKLLSLDKDSFSFFVTVSSGTYIRSLINDIGNKMGICMTMEELRRTKVGNFKIEDACNLNSINIIPIEKALEIKKVDVPSNLEKRIINGAKIDNIYDCDKVMFIKDNIPIAIYNSDKDGIMRLYRKFNL